VQLRRFLVPEATRRPNLASQCLGLALRELSQGSSGLENSAELLVATSNGSSATERAVEVQASGTSNFLITWDGFATSRDKPLMRFHGRRSSVPTGTYGTDISAGDLYFDTADNKFYCHDGVSWKAM
jgi:hypothetical protein